MPAFVGTFHEFGKQWGAPDGTREDSDFWETTLPRRMAELADELPDGKRYDSIVVDEAQDFADDWWTPVLKALRDEGLLPAEGDGGDLPADAPIAVKEAVMPFNRFRRPDGKSVDTVLGPEMRATGEVMGIGPDVGVAFAKALLAAGHILPTRGRVFLSFADRDKAMGLAVAAGQDRWPTNL